MPCFDNETATAYLRGDLTAEQSVRWAVHVANCPTCQQRIRYVSALLESVREDLLLADVQPPVIDWRHAESVMRPPSTRPGWTVLFGAAGARQLIVCSLLVLVSVLAWWLLAEHGASTVSAAELLQASATAEADTMPEPGFVALRTYSVATRRPPVTAVTETQRVEVWIDPKTHGQARRLFNAYDELMAGEWTTPDGSRIVYQRGQPPRWEASAQPKPLTASTVWRWAPSTSDFALLAGDTTHIAARSTDTGFALTLDRRTGPLATAELTLDTTYQPVAQRIVLREPDGELVEFNMAQDSAAEMHASLVDVAMFDPDAELLPALASHAPPLARYAAPRARSARALAPVMALDADRAELNVQYLLYRYVPAGCLQRTAWRKTARAFHLDVALTNEKCRQRSEGHLVSRTEDVGATVDVSVVDGSSAPVARPNTPSSEDVIDTATLRAIPLYQRLHDVYRHQDDRQTSEARIQDVVHQTRVQAQRLVASTQELRRLSHRWPDETLMRLGGTSTASWLALVEAQGREVAQAAVKLATHLRAVLDDRSSVPLPDVKRRGTLTYTRDFVAAPDDLDLDRFLTSNTLTLGSLRDVVEEIHVHTSVTDDALRKIIFPSSSPDDGLQDHIAVVVQELPRIPWLARLLQLSTFYPRDSDERSDR